MNILTLKCALTETPNTQVPIMYKPTSNLPELTSFNPLHWPCRQMCHPMRQASDGQRTRSGTSEKEVQLHFLCACNGASRASQKNKEPFLVASHHEGRQTNATPAAPPNNNIRNIRAICEHNILYKTKTPTCTPHENFVDHRTIFRNITHGHDQVSLGHWNKQPAAQVLQVSSLHLGIWQHETEANSRTLRPVPCKHGSHRWLHKWSQ